VIVLSPLSSARNTFGPEAADHNTLPAPALMISVRLQPVSMAEHLPVRFPGRTWADGFYLAADASHILTATVEVFDFI